MTENKDAVSCFLEKLLKNEPDRQDTEKQFSYFEVEKTGFSGPNAWFKITDGKESIKFQTFEEAFEEIKYQKGMHLNNGMDFRIVESNVHQKITYFKDK